MGNDGISDPVEEASGIHSLHMKTDKHFGKASPMKDKQDEMRGQDSIQTQEAKEEEEMHGKKEGKEEGKEGEGVWQGSPEMLPNQLLTWQDLGWVFSLLWVPWFLPSFWPGFLLVFPPVRHPTSI